MEYALALGIYLWAGFWMAYPVLSPHNSKGKSPWLVGIAFVIQMLVWAFVFPIHVVAVDKNRKENAVSRELADKIAEAVKRAKEEKAKQESKVDES